MGLNHVRNGKTADDPIALPSYGDLRLEDNVPAMEYLMLGGGQFSKSRKHAIWLPSFLQRFDPDTLRYYLSINMPESHDTDFTWNEFLIASTTNSLQHMVALPIEFCHYRLPDTPVGEQLPARLIQSMFIQTYAQLSKNLHADMTLSLEKHRYKEALRTAMTVAQHGSNCYSQRKPHGST